MLPRQLPCISFGIIPHTISHESRDGTELTNLINQSTVEDHHQNKSSQMVFIIVVILRLMLIAAGHLPFLFFSFLFLKDNPMYFSNRG